MEIWKDILEYEGYYQVSNKGRIKSLKRKGRLNDKILSLNVNTNGYYIVKLSKESKSITRTVHRLVITAFKKNIKNKRTVNHIDGDIINNNIENLEWATYSENHKHAYRVLNRTINSKNLKHKLRCKKVNQYDLSMNFIQTFDSIQKAGEYIGVHRTNICAAMRGRIKTCKCFIWKYKN